MQITIFGATGLVGKELLKQALEKGFQVKILVRDSTRLGELPAQVKIIEGNYFNSDNLREALAGSEAVISTVGPRSKESPEQTKDMYLSSLNTIFETMKANNIQRFINILGAATRVEGDKPQLQRKIMRFLMGLIALHLRETKQAEFQVISHSNLAWTSIRPGMITKTKGTFVAKSDQLAKSKVDVIQLAGFMLNAIHSDEWVEQAPLVATV